MKENQTPTEEMNLVTLEDSNGDEIIFEVISTVEYQSNSYVVLLPLPEFGDAEEYTILRFTENSEGEIDEFYGISDYNELTSVYKKFCTEYDEEAES